MKVLCWLALAMALAGNAAAQSGRKALVIGNAAYRKVSALKNPGNDAGDLAELLKTFHFDVTPVRDADGPALRKSIDGFAASLHSGDIAVFFFAGHGMELDGENYLVPVDFSPTNEVEAARECYRAARVRELIEKSGARVSILILDACRNNPFASGRRGAAAFGLAPMDPGLGTLIAYSTGPGQVADDNQKERNGLFTKYLLEQMRQPLDLVSLFRKTRELVWEASGRKQRPWVHEDLMDAVYLGQQPAQAPASATPAATPARAAPPKEDPLRKGQALFNRRDYKFAVAAFEDAVRGDPENAYAHNALGAAYSQLAMYKPAVSSFNMAIRLKPDYAAAYYNRGLAFMQVGEASRYQLAIEDFTWAIDQEPSDPVLYGLRGKANFAIREYDVAVADYSKAIELNPSDAASYRGRAAVYERQGNKAAAAEDLRRAAELSGARGVK